MTAKVMTSHLFNHMDIHNGNIRMYNMVAANIVSKTRSLTPDQIKAIAYKLDSVKRHSYLNQSSFFALLHTKLEEIQELFNDDSSETIEINIVLNELIHFVNHHINGRIL